MEKKFLWTKFYMEFADTLLQYKNNRTELIGKIKAVYQAAGLKLPKLESDNEVIDIDPFTVFALFNKGISDENRVKILSAIASEFEIKTDVPHTFEGIPVVNNLRATFYYFKDERGEKDIDNLWEVFDNAIQYSTSFNESYKSKLQNSYDFVRKQKGVNWNITMGLYWIRPNTFINLDARNREFITDVDNMPHYFTTIFASVNKEFPDGASYLFMCEQARNALKETDYPYHSFPELSYYAWQTTNQEGGETQPASIDANVKETAYWIYSPGDNACMWEEFYKLGIMGIGWDKIGCSLKEFASKEEIKEKMKSVYDANYSYKNNAHCLWQFANEMKVGDVVFAKKGMHKIVGKGVVTSDYMYDPKRDTYKNIRRVDWQNYGEWEHPGQAVMKTLTNISSYNDYVQKLLSLFAEETTTDEPEQKEVQYPSYTKVNFLEEVYMSESNYDTLVELLNSKYNVILQGAPGVGKTFAAKRLAYSIMGMKDTSRVAMVQFHQSYSYEDFIQGYRPADNGFKLESCPRRRRW